jgi:hypothetical protein
MPDQTSPPSLNDAVTAAGGSGGGGGGGGGTPTSVKPYDLGETQKKIAYFLLWIMVGVIVAMVSVSLVFSIRCWVEPNTCTAANTALGILISGISPMFTAMVGLVGSVVGFYFGSKQTT